MKIATVSLVLLGVAGVGLAEQMDGQEAATPRVPEQEDTAENTDAGRLYDLVGQARTELRDMRIRAGLSAWADGPQAGQRETHVAAEGPAERGAGSEEAGAYLPKMTKQNELFANGARLVLQFNPNTQVFAGSVTNTTGETLSQVRVEVHLDNGTELGPTKRIDVSPGQTIPVELGAFGNEFSSWVSHPEAGVERGHAAGGEGGGEGCGEHGGGEGPGGEGGEAAEHGGDGPGREGGRPQDPAYRPLYNQLQILRGEMHAFEVKLKAKSA